MPVLTTPTSGHLNMSSSVVRTYGPSASSYISKTPSYVPSTSSSFSLPRGSRSSYEITTGRSLYYPSAGSRSSSSSSSSSSVSSSSTLGSSFGSSSIYKSSGLTGLPSGSSVTLTRFNQRRTSIDMDYNDNDDSPLKYVSPSATSLYSTSSSTSSSPGSWRKKYSFVKKDENDNKKPSAVCGLTNLGNTCYMNAVLQALYANEKLRNFIIRHQRTPLMSALGRLFEDMGSPNNSSASPSHFRNQFIKYQPKFRGYDQQDGHEFLESLLNGLHEEVNAGVKTGRRNLDPPKTSSEAWEMYRKLDDSPLIDLFAGQLSSVITCGICGHQTVCWDPFWDLSLPLPQNLGSCDIERCLREFMSLEDLDYDEKPMCEKCRKPVPATKKLTVEKPPPLLILHVKKFTNEGYKLSTPRLTVNQKLFLKSKSYQLYACVSHHGNSTRSGHYTAYSTFDNSRWFHFNDEKVTERRHLDSSQLDDDCYILFYVESNNSTTNSTTTSYSSRL